MTKPGSSAAGPEKTGTEGRRRLSRWSALALFLFSAATLGLLAAGPAWLGAAVPGGLSAGTLLAIPGLLSGPLGGFLVAAPGSRLRFFSRVSFGAALLWYPCSALMAGNGNLIFRSGLGNHWLLMTVAVVLMSLVSGLWGALRLLVACVRAMRRTSPRDDLESGLGAGS